MSDKFPDLKKSQGRSFRYKNLAGADFRDANIRSADFTGANLIGANFQRAIGGLQFQQVIYLLLIELVIAIISIFAATFTVVLASYVLFPYQVPNYQPSNLVAAIINVIFFGVFAFLTPRRGTSATLIILTIAGILVGMAMGGIAGTIEAVASGAVAIVLSTILGALANLAIATLVATAYLSGRKLAVIVIAGGIAIGIGGGGSLASMMGTAIKRAISTVGVSTLPLTDGNPKFITVYDMWESLGSQSALITAAASIVLVIPIAIYLARKALRGNKQLAWMKTLAIRYSTSKGTKFYGANLTQANFSQAFLPQTDFRHATLIQTNFHQTQGLDRSRVGSTILVNKQVQDLLITKNGNKQSFRGLVLTGAYLAGADLREVDFTEAELSQANLEGANLIDSNLTKIQAIGTNFKNSQLTGVCIESWNIDSTTQLEQVICDYVYLLKYPQERRPSDGNFAAGGFTKFFQEILNTLDLIFQNGIDWDAFTISLQKLQIENEESELVIRSIENKGDGVVVIKVAITPDANKQSLHSSFTKQYVQALEEKHRSELKSKDEQLALSGQHRLDLLELLAKQLTAPLVPTVIGKLVVLKIGQGDLASGFPVTLQISPEGGSPTTEQSGFLPPTPKLLLLYDVWQFSYRNCLQTSSRLDVADNQITNIDHSYFLSDCNATAATLQLHLNKWLDSLEFRPIKEQMLAKLDQNSPLRIIVQTDHPQLQRLPWCAWKLIDRYPKAEIALARHNYDHSISLVPSNSKIRVLAILGDSTGIDVQQDRIYLEQLSYAEVTFLVEPQRNEIDDQLWSQPWDILFFAGHSVSPSTETGLIYLNDTEYLSLSQLRYGLQQAIRNGLKLAIFNSCDGLGLANQLAELQLPQMIVMREPVSDQVAHTFLRSFLRGLSLDLPFYQVVRAAREQLESLESQFPCATWLPVLYQNPAASSEPISWTE
jgi:uncharacterized protein YjbI with pentapeptide repeats